RSEGSLGEVTLHAFLHGDLPQAALAADGAAVAVVGAVIGIGEEITANQRTVHDRRSQVAPRMDRPAVLPLAAAQTLANGDTPEGVIGDDRTTLRAIATDQRAVHYRVVDPVGRDGSR